MNLVNKTRFLELLQKEAVLQFDNQSLYKVDNSENSEYSELILYRIVLEEQIFYKNQSHYIDLVKKCLDGETQSVMRQGFVSLAIQNTELNAESKDQNKALEEQLKQLQEQLEIVTQELPEQKERERLLQEKKEKRKNRR